MSEYTPMEIKAARILCERSADACGIDRDDNWNIYAEDFKADARAVLEGCAVPELLEALKQYVNVVASVNDLDEWKPKVVDAGAPARSALAKATGEAQ
jgi:hypothetical protein